MQQSTGEGRPEDALKSREVVAKGDSVEVRSCVETSCRLVLRWADSQNSSIRVGWEDAPRCLLQGYTACTRSTGVRLRKGSTGPGAQVCTVRM